MNENPSTQPPPGSDYLWDRSGPPDPGVQRLESMLEKFRFKGGELPDVAARTDRRSWFLSRGLAAAAAVALAVAGWWFAGRSGDEWRVEPLTGTFTLGDGTFSERRALGEGQWLRTDSASSARIRVPGLGRVDVQPDTRIQLVRSGEARDPDGTPRIEHRLEMAKGHIDVVVSAPPRVFFVDTPAATAVDYGCEYELETAENGAGLLQVHTGLVKLVRAGMESSVYAGMNCRILPVVGPGTPYWRDASDAFKFALADLDDRIAMAGGADVETPLRAVFAGARALDGVTLWHLLPRVEGERREQVYSHLAALVPPPKGVTKERVLSLDARALDAWWREIY